MQAPQPRAASEGGGLEAGGLLGLLGAQIWAQPWLEGAESGFEPRSSEPCVFINLEACLFLSELSGLTRALELDRVAQKPLHSQHV